VQKQITTLFHPHTKFPNARIHALDFAYENSQIKGKCYITFRQRITVYFPVVLFRHLTGETHLWVSQFYYAAGGSITPVSMLIISFFNPHRIFIPLHWKFTSDVYICLCKGEQNCGGGLLLAVKMARDRLKSSEAQHVLLALRLC